MRTRLTERDIELLRWHSKLGYLSTTLVSQFFFEGRVKVARRRLKRLVDTSYLSWFEKPSPSSCGRWEHVFYLNKKKRRKISYLLEEDKAYFYKPPKSTLFANHKLEIARFILCLNACCDLHKEYSFEFFPEHESRAISKEEEGQERWPLIGSGKLFFIPDCLLVIQNNLKNAKSLLYLEIDTGSETLNGFSLRNKSDILKKLKAYMNYFASRRYQKTLSEKFKYSFKGFRVLVVTKPARQSRISELCEAINTKGVVWLTSFDKVSPKTLFSPIWQVPCINKEGFQSIAKNKG